MVCHHKKDNCIRIEFFLLLPLFILLKGRGRGRVVGENFVDIHIYLFALEVCQCKMGDNAARS